MFLQTHNAFKKVKAVIRKGWGILNVFKTVFFGLTHIFYMKNLMTFVGVGKIMTLNVLRWNWTQSILKYNARFLLLHIIGHGL